MSALTTLPAPPGPPAAPPPPARLVKSLVDQWPTSAAPPSRPPGPPPGPPVTPRQIAGDGGRLGSELRRWLERPEADPLHKLARSANSSKPAAQPDEAPPMPTPTDWTHLRPVRIETSR